MSDHHQGNLKHGKATIFLQQSGFLLGSVVKVEVREIEVLRRQWAQYPGAVYCTYKEPRQKRSRRYIEGYHPYLVVLDGWGHPEPDSPWVNEHESNGCTVSEGHYSGCSAGWTSEFDQKLSVYLATHPEVKVLGDYRHTTGLDTSDVEAKAEYDAAEIESVRRQLVGAGIGESIAVEVLDPVLEELSGNIQFENRKRFIVIGMCGPGNN